MQPNSSFTETLFNRAEDYFGSNRWGRYASLAFWVKAFILLALYVAAYIYFVSTNQGLAGLLPAAFVLGVCHVFIPVNLSHDAIHGAISSHAWINRLCMYGLDITGSNSFMYREKHLEAHRDKENASKIKGIETQGLLLQKQVNGQKSNFPMIAYLFYAQYMLFIRDFALYINDGSKVNSREWLKLFFFKTCYVAAFLIIPFIVSNASWWQLLLALLVMYLVVTAVLVIILLMPTEKMKNAKTDDADMINNQWAVEILEHNVDFSPKSVFLNMVVGGANMNVVHYLFPGVNHVHYTKLAIIIERSAKEYGLLYRKQEVKDVFGIHFNYLKNIQNSQG